jgi:hypothetical protein
VLQKIEFPNGAVVFNHSPRTDLTSEGTQPPKKLENMQVLNVQQGVEHLMKTFSLTYDYYTTYNNSVIPNYWGARLRLRSVTESTSSITGKPYTLNYKHDTIQAGSPGFTHFLGTEGPLKSIVYPTGGSSAFEWEIAVPNQRAGSRIKKISDVDH